MANPGYREHQKQDFLGKSRELGKNVITVNDTVNTLKNTETKVNEMLCINFL